MKKSLLAAILAGLVGSAVAQSNVTIYGTMDHGIQSYKSGSESMTRSINHAYNTSFIGFRSREDLGGGLHAGFIVEGQINGSDGTLGSATPVAGESFNREAAVEFGGNFGSIRMGRTDITQQQNIDLFSGGAARNFASRPVNGTSIELGIDQKNAIRYTSPTWKNVTVMVGHSTGNNGQQTIDQNVKQNGVYVAYDDKKLRLYAGYQKNDGATTAAERDFTAVGGNYNLGFATVGYTWGQGDVSTTGKAVSTSQMLTVAVPLKQGYTVFTSYGTADDPTQTTANKGKGYVLGGTKSLSKRTTLFAAYTKVNNEANSRMALGWTNSAPTNRGESSTGLMAGISHNF